MNRLKKAGTHLTYHNLAHTLDVAEQAERIASEEKISEPDKLLLQIAALYHDIGYLDGPQNHEPRGCILFAGEAPQWNFSSAEIETVQRLIRATKVPQTPKDKLEEIICDADLDYLGRQDFRTLGAGLKKEYLHFGVVKNVAEWEEKQIHFLQKHRYFTQSSKKLREPRKQENLRLLLS
ncbi:MAG: HD domain-containing protein [Chitinophagales bacterium]|nr:HD domain-containing protein [Chitinophagales bacterium]